MRIIPYTEGEINMSPELPQERFRFAYHYVHSTFEDYQSGRTKIPTSQMQAQFPVSLQFSVQEVHSQAALVLVFKEVLIAYIDVESAIVVTTANIIFFIIIIFKSV